jgi:hypothetical protein
VNPAGQLGRAFESFTIALMLLLTLSVSSFAQDSSKDSTASNDGIVSKLRIDVTGADSDKPISNASVYIRWDETGGLLHKKKQAELDFKTNLDGSVKVPEVPRGKILIQVVAEGWHTFGKYYDVEKDEETIQIKLDKPPRWY